MRSPLKVLNDRLRFHMERGRQLRAYDAARQDPHMARDLGVPLKALEPRRIDQW